MDPLTDLLTRARATGSLFAETRMHGLGGLSLPGEGAALTLHVVSLGELWLQVGDDVRRLGQGDVLLVRSPTAIAVTAGPTELATPLAVLLARDDRTAAGPGVGRLTLDGPGEVAALLCGAYALVGSVGDRLLDALPPVVHLRAAPGPLSQLVAVLTAEMAGQWPGQQTALDRLLDLLLVHVLRAHFAAVETSPTWYAALGDPAVGAALRALHGDPARAWTVHTLARTAGLSRAAFARRFAAVVGEPPLTYLTSWRMTLAQEALRREGSTLAAVAREVGYGSEYALSAAFTRWAGEPPSRWRARARRAG